MLRLLTAQGCSVFVFTAEGKTKCKFGSRGGSPSQLAGPHYVAVNSHGNILISDFHNHSIKVFTADGLFLFSFGSSGNNAMLCKMCKTIVQVKAMVSSMVPLV